MNHKLKCRRSTMESERQVLIQRDRPIPYIIKNGFGNSDLRNEIRERLENYFICVVDNFLAKEVGPRVVNEVLYISKALKLANHTGVW